MLRVLSANGSRPPHFETDEARTYFKVTFYLHEAFKDTQAATPIDNRRTTVRRTRSLLRSLVLEELAQGDASQRELSNKLGYRSPSKMLSDVLNDLITEGAVEYTGN